MNAGLSATGMIPIAGEAATAAKLGLRATDTVRTADNAADAARAADNATDAVDTAMDVARAEDYIDNDRFLSEERLRHILDGDGQGKDGHGPGRGISGKSEFPSDWSDEQTIRHTLDVATDPNPTTYRRQDGGRIDQYYDKNGDPVRFVVEGIRDGVEIRVITEPAGEGTITAFPLNIEPNP